MSKPANTETPTTGTETTAEEKPAVTTTTTEEKPAATTTTEKTFTQTQFEAEKKKWEKDWNKKVADAEAKAKLSEDEKLKLERDDALKQLKERDTRDSVTDAAKDAGVKNPKLFYNAYKDELEFDDKGKVTNLKDVLDAAKAESPELFGTPAAAPAGSADAGEGKQTPGGLTKEQIDKMSPSEVAANMDAIDKFLATLK